MISSVWEAPIFSICKVVPSGKLPSGAETIIVTPSFLARPVIGALFHFSSSVVSVVSSVVSSVDSSVSFSLLVSTSVVSVEDASSSLLLSAFSEELSVSVVSSYCEEDSGVSSAALVVSSCAAFSVVVSGD